MITVLAESLIMFVYLTVPKPSFQESNREMCEEPDLVLRFMKIDSLVNEGPSYFRFWINLMKLTSMHTLHSFVFVYLFMISALILHKKMILNDSITQLYETKRESEARFNIIIRREKQEKLFRSETKLLGIYYTFIAFLILMFCGFICCLVIDILVMHKKNVYIIYSIVCSISIDLKYCLYYVFGFICILEIILILYLNYEILNIMKAHLARSYQLFNLKFKICMILLILCITSNFLYVMPFMSKSYIPLEITYKNHSLLLEMIYFCGCGVIFFACIFFICNLRFHLIYTNLDNINELFVSQFCKFPRKYYSTSPHFHSSKAKNNYGNQSNEIPKTENNYDSENEDNFENSAGSLSYLKGSLLNKDREEFNKLRKLEKNKRRSEVSLNIHLNEHHD